MTFGERLRSAMALKGLNPYQLSRMTDTDPIGVSRALRDERTHQEHTTVVRWAQACGVRAEWLSLGEGTKLAPAALHKLHDRKEWRAVADRVKRIHTELSAEDVADVGELPDAGWPARLDAALVATLAAARRAWLTRAEPLG